MQALFVHEVNAKWIGSVKNDYQIIFDKTTVIEEVEDDGTMNPTYK